MLKPSILSYCEHIKTHPKIRSLNSRHKKQNKKVPNPRDNNKYTVLSTAYRSKHKSSFFFKQRMVWEHPFESAQKEDPVISSQYSNFSRRKNNADRGWHDVVLRPPAFDRGPNHSNPRNIPGNVVSQYLTCGSYLRPDCKIIVVAELRKLPGAILR